ncbi:MAG: GNAT family N-acetyltransferase [Chloroflexota bacterium]|nr:GNAT family N-acetyltransferase [Chloroflexota bacterium]
MGTCDAMIHLRRAAEADARGIAQVHVGTWRHAYRGLLPGEYLAALTVESRERYWANEVRVLPRDRRPWLAEADRQIVGFASAGPSRDDNASPSTAEVYAVYVLPDCWDRGVGRNLLAHAERDLREHGYDEATLWVLADYERARRFYEAAGWQTDGSVKTDRIGERELMEVRYRRPLQRSRVS